MKKPDYIRCLGYDLFSDDLTTIPFNEHVVVNTINQYSYCIAEKDGAFKKALKSSTILLPDGIGVVLASKFLYGKQIKKIAGADIHAFLLQKLNVEGGSCFYLGASETTLEKIKERLSKEYPNIKVGTYSPPFKPEFSPSDNVEMIAQVNQFKPNVLFIGMTAPKQEKWCAANHDKINSNIICSIGAVFDFYAGTVERPSEKWRNLGLEWLGRLVKEPKRMWKRYIYYGFVFGYYLVYEKFKILFKVKKTQQ